MKHSKLTYYLLAILCIMATSCVTDGVMDECPDKSVNMVSDARVKLVLNFAINNAATRAGEADGSTTDGEIDERKIKDVHIYAFQNDKFIEEVKYVSLLGSDGDKTRIIQGTLTESYNSRIPVKLVVIVNGEEKGVITPGNPTLTNTTTPQSLYNQLIYDYSNRNNWNTYIPMAGECEINPLQEGDYNTAKLELTRAIAKVNVTVNGGKGLDNFRITQIRLCNYNTKGYCAANTTPFIPESVTRSKTPMSSEVFSGKEGNSYENQFYIPEHKNIEMPQEKQVYLEIDAMVKNESKKYRLDFIYKNNTHDVIRNFLYVFNIQSVKMDDVTPTLEYEVKAWKEVTVDIPSFN